MIKFIYLDYLSSIRLISVILLGGASCTLHAAEPIIAYPLDVLTVTSNQKEKPILKKATVEYSSDTLEALALDDLEAISTFLPSVRIQEQSINVANIIMRGIASDAANVFASPRISMLQDGMDISLRHISNVAIFDVQKIQVYTGPQATRFGRASQVGAINVLSNRARNENNGQTQIGYGNDNLIFVSGHQNTVLIDGSLFGRIAYYIKKRDGYIKNVSGSDLQGEDSKALRASLHWQGANTDIDFITNYQHDTPPGTAFKSQFFANTDRFSRDEAHLNSDVAINRDLWNTNLIIEHSLNKQWQLNSQTTYLKYDTFERFDADGFELPILLFDSKYKGEQFSQSFRFNFSNQKAFNARFGVDYFWQRTALKSTGFVNEQYLINFPAVINALTGSSLPLTPPPVFAPFVGGFPNPNPFLNDRIIEQQTTQGEKSSFDLVADFNWQATQKTTLNAGVRLMRETQNSNIITPAALSPSIAFPGNIFFTPANGDFNVKGSNIAAVWQFGLSQQFNDSLEGIARYARGARPKVLGFASNSQLQDLKSETVDTVEVGLKLHPTTQNWQIDGTLFYQDYENFQTTINQGLSLVSDDSGSATVYGLELSARALIMDNTHIFSNINYNHARIDDKRSLALANNHFRLSPDFSGAIGIHHQIPLKDNGHFFLGVITSLQSKMYFDDENQFKQGGYAITTLRTGYVDQLDRWQINLQINNIFDREYNIDVGNTGSRFGIPTFIPAQPINAMLSLRFRY